MYHPAEKVGEGRAAGREPGSAQWEGGGFTLIKALLCGCIWLGLCGEGS